MNAEPIAHALDYLAGEPRWLTWRLEDRKGKPTKIPYTSWGRYAKSEDPATWDILESCVVKARTYEGRGGVGIVLGDISNDLYLAGIDLDSCLEDGALASWAQPFLDAIPSYAEVSPSGTGLKAFFCIEADNVRPFLKMNGITNPTQWGFNRSIPGLSKENHGPGVELYTSHRYFAVTGQLWPGQPDRVITLDWEALERLAALIPPAKSNGAAKSNGHAKGDGTVSVNGYSHGGDGGGTGGGSDNSRSARAMSKGLALKRAGKTFEEMCDALRADPEVADWVREKGEISGQRELRRIWDKADAPIAPSSNPEIVRLAELSVEEYEEQRASIAKKLNYRKSVLDKLVEAERAKNVAVEPGNLPGHALKLREFEPWPQPVKGPDLLNQITKDIQNYVVMTERQAQAVAYG